jgi:hypothetical protein
MPRPCRSPAMPCRWGFRMCLSHLIYTVRPYLIHTCHAMLQPCRSSKGHGKARPSKDGLWAIWPCSASSGYHAEFHEVSYDTHTNLRCRWPVSNQTPFAWTRKSMVAAHYKKDDLLHCWTISSDISGYHADFHEGHGAVGAGQGCGMEYVN